MSSARQFARASALLRGVDDVRRQFGTVLDVLQLAPIETPNEIVHTEAGMRLARYEGAARDGPVVLIVPAPIKRHYIWDLEPSCSVVRHALHRGCRVYAVQWEGGANGRGLDDVVGQIARAVEGIARDCGRKPHLFSHSLGGTLCAAYAARYPEGAATLALVGVPLRVGTAAGDLAAVLDALPERDELQAAVPDVPGSLLTVGAVLGCPSEFVWQREVDAWLSAFDARAAVRHGRVLRWTFDELPMPGPLFAQSVEVLRTDALVTGQLRLHGRTVHAEDLTVPITAVVDPRSLVAPPGSIVPFVAATSSRHKRVLSYRGDAGVALQHVGPLVGSAAHRNLWPRIFDAILGESCPG